MANTLAAARDAPIALDGHKISVRTTLGTDGDSVRTVTPYGLAAQYVLAALSIGLSQFGGSSYRSSWRCLNFCAWSVIRRLPSS
jgi:hypothetical protein